MLRLLAVLVVALVFNTPATAKEPEWQTWNVWAVSEQGEITRVSVSKVDLNLVDDYNAWSTSYCQKLVLHIIFPGQGDALPVRLFCTIGTSKEE
jgi:hypothetical protein